MTSFEANVKETKLLHDSAFMHAAKSHSTLLRIKLHPRCSWKHAIWIFFSFVEHIIELHVSKKRLLFNLSSFTLFYFNLFYLIISWIHAAIMGLVSNSYENSCLPLFLSFWRDFKCSLKCFVPFRGTSGQFEEITFQYRRVMFQ